jgi:hypothetical protein
MDRQAKILAIIMEVEMVKMLNPPLTPQQRTVLMLMLNGSGRSLQEIAAAGKVVMMKTTYGTIAFEHWKEELELLAPRLKVCPKCRNRWDWRATGQTICPECYPLTKVSK